MRRLGLFAFGLAAVIPFSSQGHVHAADQVPPKNATRRPNILILVADDLGWVDVGFLGSKIKTPNIDRLCAGGGELTQHYVQPMCTPTGVGLLTGRYPS